MGVEATHYVMAAIKIPLPKFELDAAEDEAYEKRRPFEDNGYSDDITIHQGLTTVTDGMNGKYVMVGKVLSKGRSYEGLDMTECVVSDKERSQIKRLAKKHLGVSGEVSVYAFTHFH